MNKSFLAVGIPSRSAPHCRSGSLTLRPHTGPMLAAFAEMRLGRGAAVR